MTRFSIHIILLLVFSSQYVCSQTMKDHFILNGKLTGADNRIIYLSYYDDESQTGKTDSSRIKNGLFSFSGKLRQPAVAFIALKKGEAFGLNAYNIFLEPSAMNLDLVLNKFSKAHMTGSGIQNDYEQIKEKKVKIKSSYPVLFDSSGYAHENLDSSLLKKVEIIYDSLDLVEYNYFDQHPTSYLTAYLLQFQARRLSQDSLAIFYNRLSDHLKNHVVTQNIRARLKNRKVGAVGTIAPKFHAKDTSGNDFYSGIIKGKYILLDFWASWCVPCRENSPDLIELNKKYKDKGLRIVGVADDRDLNKWKEAIEKDKTNLWTHVLRGANHELKIKGLTDVNDIHDKFNISMLPSYILIDTNGVIIGRFQDNLNDLSKLLQTLLK